MSSPLSGRYSLSSDGRYFSPWSLDFGSGRLVHGKICHFEGKHVKEILAIRDSSLLMWFQNPHACLLQYS